MASLAEREGITSPKALAKTDVLSCAGVDPDTDARHVCRGWEACSDVGINGV